MKVICPPKRYTPDNNEISLFLGGSIELGRAENWQDRLINDLEGHEFSGRLVIYNPRRLDWEDTIPLNDPDNPDFKAQVEWELDYQTQAQMLVYYFAADTLSPISLLELGLFKEKKPTIGANTSYQRYGNLMITAAYYDLPVYSDWEGFQAAIFKEISSL